MTDHWNNSFDKMLINFGTSEAIDIVVLNEPYIGYTASEQINTIVQEEFGNAFLKTAERVAASDNPAIKEYLGAALSVMDAYSVVFCVVMLLYQKSMTELRREIMELDGGLDG